MSRNLQIDIILGAVTAFKTKLPRSREGIRGLANAIVGSCDPAPGEAVVVGVSLDPVIELASLLSRSVFGGRVAGPLSALEEEMSVLGMDVERRVAAYPNIDTPRFCIPFGSKCSRRFLSDVLFFPRRYSLNWRSRLMFWIFQNLTAVNAFGDALHPAAFLRFVRR